MNIFAILILSIVADATFGDPRMIWSRIPHPVQIMGRAISWLEQRLNNGSIRKIKGVFTILLLVPGALVLGWIISKLPDFGFFEVLVVAILLGHRALSDHVLDVANGLSVGLTEGRIAVAKIVGRDTANLDASGITRGAIESAAENFSDGFIAPVFWYLVLGLPGIVAYKMINTADSMIGYRNARYNQFGWAAARLDDLVNYIPARLSAALIVMTSWSKTAVGIIRSDAGLHRSPNAGWPEAAMAGALAIALSGPRSYHGELGDEPYVNGEARRQLAAPDIRRSVKVIWRAWAGVAIAVAVLALLTF